MEMIPGKLYKVKEELGACNNRQAHTYNFDIPAESTLMLLKEEYDLIENRLYCQFLFGVKSCWITFCDCDANPYDWAGQFLDPVR